MGKNWPWMAGYHEPSELQLAGVKITERLTVPIGSRKRQLSQQSVQKSGYFLYSDRSYQMGPISSPLTINFPLLPGFHPRFSLSFFGAYPPYIV